MRASMTRLWLSQAGLCVMVCLTSGCSVFRGSRALDMSPFAENTSAMFAEAAKVSRPFRYVYLKPYIDIPETRELKRRGNPLIQGLRGLVMYSNQVVALNMASKPDREKNRLLADYLQEAAGKVAGRERLANLGISAPALDSTLTAIRSAKKFKDGIAAASPLVNVVVLALLDGLDDLNSSIPEVIQAIDAGIERTYKDKRTAYEGLTKLRTRYLIAATWLYEVKSGNPTAVDSLLRIDPSMRVFIPSAERVTPQQLNTAEKALVERLARIDSLIEQLSADRELYLATHQELQDFRINLDQRIKVARDAVVVWGQSHRNLGIGVPVPPLINLSAIASGAAKAVPVP